MSGLADVSSRWESGSWTLARASSAIRKFWVLIAGITVIGAAIGYGVAAATTPQYQSTATLYFAMNAGTTGADLNQGSTYTQGQMLSFAQLATSSRVLSEVIDELDLDISPRDLARNISIAVPQDTAILDVQVTSESAERAAVLANAISEKLTAVVQDVVAKGPDGTATITASVIDEAVVPLVQSSPSKTRDAALAGVLGLVVGVLAAFLATILDTKVRNEAAVAQVTDAPFLGSITRLKYGVPGGLVVARDSRSHFAEDFRRVQSALAFANVDGEAKRLLITSATPGEGKSTFASNLAVTLAQLGERTTLIDADLRRPKVADVFGVDGSIGLTTVVRGVMTRDEAVLSWGEAGLGLLLTGVLPPSPATVLTSDAFAETLDRVGDDSDQVLIDSPPVLTVADTNLIAPLVDGVIIVVDSSRTSRAQLAATLRTLEGAGAKIVGIVLNKVRLARDRQTYYSE